MKLQFAALTPVDYPLLLAWLQRPHVKQWWDDGDDTLEKVAQHYGSDADRRFLIVADDLSIGYIQYYLQDDGAAGIDLFIGEQTHLQRGVGTQTLHAFLALVIARCDPPRIVIDPAPENARAIRCYEKVGFRHYATLTNEEHKLAYMMQIVRVP